MGFFFMFLCSVKQFRQKQQRPKKSSLVIGRTAVLDALQEGKQLDRIYMQSNLRGDVADEIIELFEKEKSNGQKDNN